MLRRGCPACCLLGGAKTTVQGHPKKGERVSPKASNKHGEAILPCDACG